MTRDLLAVLWRGFAVWLAIVFAETLHGTARIIFLQPVLGDFRSRQVSVFSGMLIILAIAYFFIQWIRAANGFQLLAVGLLWMILTVAFEFSLGRLMNLSWQRILSDYDIANGGLMAIGLLFLFFAPALAAKLKNRFARKLKTSDPQKTLKAHGIIV